MKKLQAIYEKHPHLSMWAVLATGMVTILIFAARAVGFTPWQWVALIGVTILLAGACVWIISWEDGPDEDAKMDEVSQQ